MPAIAFSLRSVTYNTLVGKELQRMSCPQTFRIDIMPVISNTHSALHKQWMSKPTGGHAKYSTG